MKIILFIAILFGSFFLHAQKNMSIEGKWLMDRVIQNDEDVTAQHNPESDRYIIFLSDGSFRSGGAPYGENTGKYFYDISAMELKLDSDAGEEDDSIWKIEFEEGMKWQGIGSEWAEEFRITYKRSE